MKNELYEFSIICSDYKDVLKYHAGGVYTISVRKNEWTLSNVRAICKRKRKNKDGSSKITFLVDEKYKQENK